MAATNWVEVSIVSAAHLFRLTHLTRSHLDGGQNIHISMYSQRLTGETSMRRGFP